MSEGVGLPATFDAPPVDASTVHEAININYVFLCMVERHLLEHRATQRESAQPSTAQEIWERNGSAVCIPASLITTTVLLHVIAFSDQSSLLIPVGGVHDATSTLAI